jgi:hypothetical protein
MELSDRMSRLGTETAFQVLVKAQALEAKGKHIIHLEIGEPDFDTPSHIRLSRLEPWACPRYSIGLSGSGLQL